MQLERQATASALALRQQSGLLYVNVIPAYPTWDPLLDHLGLWLV